MCVKVSSSESEKEDRLPEDPHSTEPLDAAHEEPESMVEDDTVPQVECSVDPNQQESDSAVDDDTFSPARHGTMDPATPKAESPTDGDTFRPTQHSVGSPDPSRPESKSMEEDDTLSTQHSVGPVDLMHWESKTVIEYDTLLSSRHSVDLPDPEFPESESLVQQDTLPTAQVSVDQEHLSEGTEELEQMGSDHPLTSNQVGNSQRHVACLESECPDSETLVEHDSMPTAQQGMDQEHYSEGAEELERVDLDQSLTSNQVGISQCRTAFLDQERPDSESLVEHDSMPTAQHGLDHVHSSEGAKGLEQVGSSLTSNQVGNLQHPMASLDSECPDSETLVEHDSMPTAQHAMDHESCSERTEELEETRLSVSTNEMGISQRHGSETDLHPGSSHPGFVPAFKVQDVETTFVDAGPTQRQPEADKGEADFSREEFDSRRQPDQPSASRADKSQPQRRDRDHRDDRYDYGRHDDRRYHGNEARGRYGDGDYQSDDRHRHRNDHRKHSSHHHHYHDDRDRHRDSSRDR